MRISREESAALRERVRKFAAVHRLRLTDLCYRLCAEAGICQATMYRILEARPVTWGTALAVSQALDRLEKEKQMAEETLIQREVADEEKGSVK